MLTTILTAIGGVLVGLIPKVLDAIKAARAEADKDTLVQAYRDASREDKARLIEALVEAEGAIDSATAERKNHNITRQALSAAQDEIRALEDRCKTCKDRQNDDARPDPQP